MITTLSSAARQGISECDMLRLLETPGLDGDMVVDLSGSWADEGRTVPWTANTITNVVSTTKTMTSLAALVLVDRGELDLDASVAKYWPKFAARGKENVSTVQLVVLVGVLRQGCRSRQSYWIAAVDHGEMAVCGERLQGWRGMANGVGELLVLFRQARRLAGDDALPQGDGSLSHRNHEDHRPAELAVQGRDVM
jgi:hypothetical protein